MPSPFPGIALVTVIEILSPINKREPNLSKYRDKVTDMYQASVHVLEIDLFRRGVRIHADARLQAAAYLLTLTRAMESKLEALQFSQSHARHD